MSVLLALVFVLVCVLVQKVRNTVAGSSVRASSSRGLSPRAAFGWLRRGRNAMSRQCQACLVAIVVGAVGIAVDSACRIATSRPLSSTVGNRNEDAAVLSQGGPRETRIAIADSDLAADLALVRALRKALTKCLTDTNAKLQNDPRDTTLVKRKQLLELLLANRGGTGVNDRLGAFEALVRNSKSSDVPTPEEEMMEGKAIANLRSSAASWKSGSFAIAGRYVGLEWIEGKGLIASTPYIWGSNGWEADLVRNATHKKGSGPSSVTVACTACAAAER
jgi:hypothetical protein